MTARREATLRHDAASPPAHMALCRILPRVVGLDHLEQGRAARDVAGTIIVSLLNDLSIVKLSASRMHRRSNERRIHEDIQPNSFRL